MLRETSLADLAALERVTDQIITNQETHKVLKEGLGDVWGYAVGYFGDNTKAAGFLLNQNKGLGGESPLQYCVRSEQNREQMTGVLFRGISDLHF